MDTFRRPLGFFWISWQELRLLRRASRWKLIQQKPSKRPPKSLHWLGIKVGPKLVWSHICSFTKLEFHEKYTFQITISALASRKWLNQKNNIVLITNPSEIIWTLILYIFFFAGGHQFIKISRYLILINQII